MRLAISSIVFVAAFALVGCEKKVEAPAAVDAAVVEAADACVDPACCEADASVPVAPLTAPTAPAAPVVPATSAATTSAVAPAPATVPVAAPTTTINKK